MINRLEQLASQFPLVRIGPWPDPTGQRLVATVRIRGWRVPVWRPAEDARPPAASTFCRTGPRPTGRLGLLTVTMTALTQWQPAWAEDFEGLAARIRDAVGAEIVRVDHIGSTSVPGMAAKDCIDVQVIVRGLPNDRLVAGFLAAGFSESLVRTSSETMYPNAGKVTRLHGTNVSSGLRRTVGSATCTCALRAGPTSGMPCCFATS